LKSDDSKTFALEEELAELYDFQKISKNKSKEAGNVCVR
jgi:hypothetical protein